MEFKGITWAGNLYQKFEAVCLEVEKVMNQDTVKYLENQVQTVGSSVKKFYSEVVEDFLPPSCIDPVKVTGSDLRINPYYSLATKNSKKPKQSITGIPKEAKAKTIEEFEAVAEKTAEDESSFVELDGVTRSQTSDGDFCINRCSESYSGKRRSRGLYRRHAVGSKGSSNGGCTPKISGSSPPSWNPSRISSSREIRSGVLSASIKSHDSVRANDISHMMEKDVCMSNACYSPSPCTSSSCETVTQKQDDLSSTSTHDLPSESIGTLHDITSNMESMIDSSTCASGGEDLISTCQGRLYNSGIDVFSNFVEPGLEIVERLAESRFEDTCVLVEGDELHAISQKEGKHKSYKKKIKEAFSSKMRSTRKKEYQKLAACYSLEAPNLDSKESTETSNPKKLQAQLILDSEWELL